MQLYILGPAFGLPSIDPECLAATALLQQSGSEDWTLHPTHDLSHPLPRLIDGDNVFEGFNAISQRISRPSESKDNAALRANSTAISSFIRTHGQSLLDISLYVASENYSTTRSAFTKILPWYTNYFLPPKRRAEARSRTEHLGISSIDVEDVHEDLSNRQAAGFDVGKQPKFEAETQKKASLLLPAKRTVRSFLQRPEHSAVFKLHALADNFFGPLQDMLGDDGYFSGVNKPTAVDCLVYGYLSLMLFPVLPQDWLAKTMRRKYGKLVLFTERMNETLGMQTNVEDVNVLIEQQRRGNVGRSLELPWAAPPTITYINAAKSVALNLVSLMPIMRPFQIHVIQSNSQPTKSWQRQYLPAAFTISITTIGLLTYYAFSTGYLVWPHGETVHIFGRKRLADYGHLGAALAGISLLGQQATNDFAVYPPDSQDIPARVEVAVEKDVAR